MGIHLHRSHYATSVLYNHRPCLIFLNSLIRPDPRLIRSAASSKSHLSWISKSPIYDTPQQSPLITIHCSSSPPLSACSVYCYYTSPQYQEPDRYALTARPLSNSLHYPVFGGTCAINGPFNKSTVIRSICRSGLSRHHPSYQVLSR